MNYFTLFNLPQIFQINLDKLHQQYIVLQRQFHPDAIQQDNTKFSVDINKGYRILKDDVSRAEHLLVLMGVDITKNKVEEGFLMDILEEFEGIENTKALLVLKNLLFMKNQQKKELIANLGSYFAQNNLNLTVQTFLKLKYLNNVVRNLKNRITNAVN